MESLNTAFDDGYQAYLDGVKACDVREKNPYDADEFPKEWDEWEDGWATARLKAYLPWYEQVKAKMVPGTAYIGDFYQYFDDEMTPEEAIAENQVEVDKHNVLLDPNKN